MEAHLIWPLPNVHLGVSVEDQNSANERVPHLLRCPAAVRWLSVEPMLGPVDLNLVRHPMAGELLDLGALCCPSCGYTAKDKAEQGDHRLCKSPGPTIDWVVCGGESGPGARPMHPDWVRSLRGQCAHAGVAFNFKQWGAWAPWSHDGRLGDICGKRAGFFDHCERWHEFGINPSRYSMVRVGKSKAGRLLDGVTHDAYPEVVYE